MPNLKIRHLTTRRSANGRLRFYWQPSQLLDRAGFKLLRLSDDRSQAIVTAEQINARSDAWRLSAEEKTEPRSLAALISSYKKSGEFTDLAPNTRRQYECCFRFLKAWGGKRQVASFTKLDVIALKELLRTQPGKQRAIIRVLRILFNFAIGLEWIPLNPASRPGLTKGRSRRSCLSREQLMRLVTEADASGKPWLGDGALLMFYLVQRPVDVVMLREEYYNHLKDCFEFTQKKTGEEMQLPLYPILKARFPHLGGRPGPLVTNRPGDPAQMCQRTFRRDAAALMAKVFPGQDVTFADLRRSGHTHLQLSSCTAIEGASWAGWRIQKSVDQMETYTARRLEIARGAMEKVLQYEQRVLQ